VFHVAALYRFWARSPRQFYDINVGGAINVTDAARATGVERMVYTSTVGTLGLEAAHAGGAADERDYPDISHLFGSYKRSKYVAEHEVLRAAAQGLPVSIVMPTFPLGPRDISPTPTGRLVLDYLNGRVPGYVDTTLNVAHVDDVARGHVLALERGAMGRSYILGGENYSLQRLLADLAACTGLPEARLRVPRALSLGVAHVSEFVEGRLLRRHPSVPLEAARMSTTHMAFDDTRARKELGYEPRPAAEAIESSARWFVEHGYVKASRRARISWGDSTAT
jgi:dihydroflavonol-4-reductase